MKAKEYAHRYKENETQDTLADIMTDFIEEIGEIASVRHAQRPNAVAAIFDEQERKWHSFAELTGVNQQLFKLAVKEIMPEAFLAWQVFRNKKP